MKFVIVVRMEKYFWPCQVVGPFDSDSFAEEWLKKDGWQYAANLIWRKEGSHSHGPLVAMIKELEKPNR